MDIENTLFLIPARGGSKGLPRKNIAPLAGKPMIYYTIDAARGVTSDEHICVSTDEAEIRQLVEIYGLHVPFIRPAELATDTAGTRDVILHALDFYRESGKDRYAKVCLLQPTSPLRTAQHIREAHELWDDTLDMVVSVKESRANPYFNLFEEGENGFLRKSKKGDYLRRQDAPNVWKFNGAIYFISSESIRQKSFVDFEKIRKYIMSETSSVDIDGAMDMLIAQTLLCA